MFNFRVENLNGVEIRKLILKLIQLILELNDLPKQNLNFKYKFTFKYNLLIIYFSF